MKEIFSAHSYPSWDQKMRARHPYQPWLIGLAFLLSLITHAWAVLTITWQDPLASLGKTSPTRTPMRLYTYQIPQPAPPIIPVEIPTKQAYSQEIIHTKQTSTAKVPVKKLKPTQESAQISKPKKEDLPVHHKTPKLEQTPVTTPNTKVPSTPISTPVKTNETLKVSQELEQAYYQALIQHLSEYKHYPINARRRGIEGKVELKIHLNAEGTLLNIQVLQSSHPWLQKAAIKSVQEALPFQKINWVFAKQEKDFLVILEFELN